MSGKTECNDYNIQGVLFEKKKIYGCEGDDTKCNNCLWKIRTTLTVNIPKQYTFSRSLCMSLKWERCVALNDYIYSGISLEDMDNLTVHF